MKKDREEKANKQRKTALSFSTKKGVTFSMFTDSNIKNGQDGKKNHSAIEETQKTIISEVDEDNGYIGNN